MAESTGQHGSERLDRIEKMVEALAGAQIGSEEEHKKLLTAQILMVDAHKHADERLAALADKVDTLADTVKAGDDTLNEKIKTLTANMNALINTVDDIIRGGKRPNGETHQ
jgi:ABC-type transporter Mla subunit MlaD